MLLLSTALSLGLAHAGAIDPVATGGDQAYGARRVAVLIGIEAYGDPALQGLRYPAKDAVDLGRVLADQELGGFDRVVVVTGASATSMEGVREALTDATADLQRDDTFLLYMSGHGTLTLDPAMGSRLFVFPSDGLLEEPEDTALSVDWLEEFVSELPARRRVLVLDTCHNGRMGSKSVLSDGTSQLVAGLRGEPPAPRDLREVSESEARLFAAQYYQPAMEDPNLENGVYTHYLIEALTADSDTADLDRDGLVDVTEAHEFARDQTIEHTSGVQVPRAEYRIVGREEIYLSGDPSRRKGAEEALISACDQLLARAQLYIDGIPRGALPGLSAVEPGLRRVTVRAENGDVLVNRTVRLEAGEKLPIEVLFERTRPAAYFIGGVVARSDNGSSFPYAPELEFGVLHPWRSPTWLVPGLEVRATMRSGDLPTPFPDGPVTSGEVAGGAFVGLKVLGPLSIGPMAEVVMPYWLYDDGVENHPQATFTGALGGRAMVVVPVGDASVTLRYDTRVSGYDFATDWTTLWHNGLGIGVVLPRS